jgi:polyisoprenyl-teichoic acid--peptidoglycan teichoic acid transferase
MSTPQRAPRSRSPFAAAFLSLIFPGLGHAYDGAYARALGFAAAPLLVLAFGAGVVLRVDKAQLLGTLVSQTALMAIFVVNILALVYRIVAAVDAWQVARFLNARDAAGTGGLGRAKLPLNPVSIAGLVAVVVVMGMGHLAIARYNVLALDLVNCVFSEDGESADCSDGGDGGDTAQASTDPTDTASTPAETDTPDGSSSPAVSDAPPTPDAGATGTLAPTLAPWDGTERLNVVMVGVDARGNDKTYNTDTLIVVSIDPVSKQVAMFQVPRDMVDVPVPANARGLWGSTYGGKINSWWMQNRNRTDLWRGKTATTRGYNALKSILGELYGLDIRYYVKVDFDGFRKVVNTMGGVQINVQIPVYESMYPIMGDLTRVYIPAGPQHMSGAQALVYARSRHRTSDFDRGRRQQRVLLSLREQMDAASIVENLPGLVKALKSSVSTDVPISEMAKLLALAESVDTKNIRSYVFSPSYYASETLNSSRGYIIQPNVVRIRKAVKEAFTVKASVLAQREQLGAEGARVWVKNASGVAGKASDVAEYLAYFGADASAPNTKNPPTTAKTKIVVYNGAEAEMVETIAYLEKKFGVTATMATDPTVPVDIVVTLGQNSPKLSIEAVG